MIVVCPTCNGKGHIPAPSGRGVLDCVVCEGTGQYDDGAPEDEKPRSEEPRPEPPPPPPNAQALSKDLRVWQYVLLDGNQHFQRGSDDLEEIKTWAKRMMVPSGIYERIARVLPPTEANVIFDAPPA